MELSFRPSVRAIALNIAPYPVKVGECRVCGVPMMSKARWAQSSPQAREGYKAHGGQGLCRAHHHKALRYGDPTHAPAPKRVRRTRLVEPCVDCGRPTAWSRDRKADPELAKNTLARKGRGRCTACNTAWWAAHPDAERRRRLASEVLEDWEFLRDDGVRLPEAARRMGMTQRALEIALQRARRRGDPRGSLVPFAHDMRRAA